MNWSVGRTWFAASLIWADKRRLWRSLVALLVAAGAMVVLTLSPSIARASETTSSSSYYLASVDRTVQAGASISGNGRFIVFLSPDPRSGPGDTTYLPRVFVHDRETGTSERVSVSTGGAWSNDQSLNTAISGDGRFVAFSSLASNLVPGDTNGDEDVFVRDRLNGTTQRVSVTSTGAQVNGFSWAPSISGDGRYLAFVTERRLVPNAPDWSFEVYVRDLMTGSIEWVSRTASGGPGNYSSERPSISDDGNLVVFESGASNMVAGDMNGGPDIFLRNRSAGTTTLISANSSGFPGDQGSYLPSISGDGSTVSFETFATDLIAGDTNGVVDVVIGHLGAGQLNFLSVGTDAQPGDEGFDALGPSMSKNGRFVAFESDAPDLVDVVVGPGTHTYVHDLFLGVTRLLTSDGEPQPWWWQSNSPSLDDSGRYVSFSTNAPLLPPNSGTYIKDLGPAPYPIRATELYGEPLAWSNDCPCRGEAGDPVNTWSGNEHFALPGLGASGRGPGVGFSLSYNSLDGARSGSVGHGWTHSYDLRLVDDAAGSKTIVQENGSTVTFLPDGAGGWEAPPRVRATLVTGPNGSFVFTRKHFETFTFDGAGALVSVADQFGNATTLTYSAGLLSSVQDSAGHALSFTWSNGRISTVTDSRSVSDGGPRSVSLSYDPAGDLVSYTDVGGGVWTLGYDGAHRLTSVQRPRHAGSAVAVTMHYDAAGRQDWQEDELGRRTSFFYDDPVVGATRVVDPNGDVHVDWYEEGRRVRVTDGYGTTEQADTYFTYDLGTLALEEMIDPSGQSWLYENDSAGNRTKTTDPLGRTTTVTYDAFDQPTSITEPSGVITVFDYDPVNGRLESVTEADGTAVEGVVDLVYGDLSHPEDMTEVVDARGNSWMTTYDASTGAPVSSTDPESNTTSYLYNSIGWQTGVVAPAGNAPGATPADFTSTVEHDDVGRPLAVTNAEGETTTFSYDANGNLAWVEGHDGDRTTFTYNDADELVVEERPDSTTIGYTFGPSGLLDARTDAAGEDTTYTYSARGQVETSTDPLGRTTTYFHDLVGRLAAVQEPGGNCSTNTGCVSYTYDVAGQLTDVDYSDPATPDASFTYDLDGLPATMTDGTGTSQWDWDERDRLVAFTDGTGTELSYGYDLVGNQTEITYPGRQTPVTRTFDQANRLTAVTDWLGQTTTFAWDPNQNLDTVTFPMLSNNEDRYHYDRADRMTGIDWTHLGSSYASASYTRHDDGLLATAMEVGLPAGPSSFGYDQLDQLTDLDGIAGTFTYDAADNLTRTAAGATQTFDAANQLTASGAVTFSYDNRGNRVAAAGPSGTTAYAYNQANQLTGVGNIGYVYDGTGLLAARTETTVQPVLGPTTNVTTSTWDRSTPIPLLLTRTDSLGFKTNIIYGPGNKPIAEINALGLTTWLHTDQLGSIRATTNQVGLTTSTHTYSPHGTETGSTGTHQPVLGWAGEQADPGTNLVYLRARWYDPETGQFLTRDPIEAITQDPYGYAGNNPINATDPTGLFRIPGTNICVDIADPNCESPGIDAVVPDCFTWQDNCESIASRASGGTYCSVQFDEGCAATGSFNARICPVTFCVDATYDVETHDLAVHGGIGPAVYAGAGYTRSPAPACEPRFELFGSVGPYFASWDGENTGQSVGPSHAQLPYGGGFVVWFN